jgi:nucleotide-binding universal stress UspA family protein
MDGKKIIIATHNTGDSRNVIGQVVDWMKEMKGRADATLLYVVDERVVHEASLGDNGTFLGYGEKKDLILQRAKEGAEAYLRELKEVYEKHGIPVRTKVRVGYPSKEILKEANDQGAYAVIIGTHSRSHWSKSIFGSITNEVVLGAPCPVIVFTPKLLKFTDRLKKRVSLRVKNFETFLSQ